MSRIPDCREQNSPCAPLVSVSRQWSADSIPGHAPTSGFCRECDRAPVAQEGVFPRRPLFFAKRGLFSILLGDKRSAQMGTSFFFRGFQNHRGDAPRVWFPEGFGDFEWISAQMCGHSGSCRITDASSRECDRLQVHRTMASLAVSE